MALVRFSFSYLIIGICTGLCLEFLYVQFVKDSCVFKPGLYLRSMEMFCRLRWLKCVGCFTLTHDQNEKEHIKRNTSLIYVMHRGGSYVVQNLYVPKIQKHALHQFLESWPCTPFQSRLATIYYTLNLHAS